MKQKKKHSTAPVISPAGMRQDSRKPGNVPAPDRESVEEERRWQEEHIQ